MVLEAESDV